MLDADMVIVFALAIGMLVLFFREVLPIPITALLVAVTLMATGILTPDEGLSGFSSPATIAVLAMFVLSAGVQQTGAVYALTTRLMKWAGTDPRRQIVALAAATGPISGFVNNTPVVAVMIPACQNLAKRSGISVSKLLMPVSTFAMLGGLLTVIGTSTNLLGNATLRRLGIEPFGFFEFTIIGAIALATGVIYYATAGRWLLPDRGTGGAVERFDLKGFFGEYIVEPDGPLVGQTLRDAGLTFAKGSQVVRIYRGDEALDAPDPRTRLQPGDALLVEASRERLTTLGATTGLAALPEVLHPLELEGEQRGDMATAEVVITTGSRFIGRTIADIDFRRRFGAHVLAVRHHAHVETGTISRSRLRAGDILMVQAPLDTVERMREQPDLFVTRERPVESYRRDRLAVALGIVAAVVLVSAFGWMDIVVAALAGATLMVLTGCLRVEEFWRAIHWDVIFLLAGVIPLGVALEKTGGADLLARGLAALAGQVPAAGFLFLVFLVTTLITEVVSNNASVVLLVPVVVAASIAIGVDPRPVALTVILAASTSMMTPIGYQTNTMVYAPGNYRFSDFARVGAPLNLILTFVIPWAIAWRFPL